MLSGTVSVDGVPTITLFIAEQDLTSTIDTGFNGDLELPEFLQKALNSRFVGRAISALAGGQTIEEDVYLVDFPFDGRVVAGHDILIGTRLLREYRLQINFVSQTVELERVFAS